MKARLQESLAAVAGLAAWLVCAPLLAAVPAFKIYNLLGDPAVPVALPVGREEKNIEY